MVRQNNQVRFGVLWNKTPYDLFSLFATKDETICLTTYLKPGKISKISKMGIKNVGKAVEGRIQFDVDLKEIPMYEFAPQKMSFHQSGYIHETNKQGGRIRELDGKRGLSFEEIVDCATLFSLYPMTPENYRKHTSLTKNVQLVDVRQFGFVPYQITCYLSKSDYDFSQEIMRMDRIYEGTKSLSLRCKNYLPTYSLDLFVRFHKSSLLFFPTREAICYFCKP